MITSCDVPRFRADPEMIRRRPIEQHPLDVTGQQMDETFLRGSERFSELLARGDVAPCPNHLDRIARSVPRCRQLVLCRAPSPGSELAPWGRVLSE